MKHNDETYHELVALNSKLKDSEVNNPYQLPVDYFDGMLNNLKAKIAEENIIAMASKQMPYHTPNDYFTQNTLKPKTHTITEDKTRPFVASKWLAVAAMLFLAIGFGLFHYTVQPATVQQQLATLHKEGIINEYIQEHIDDFDSDLIEQAYAEQTDKLMPTKLSEDEIQQYLNETGWN